MSEITDAGVAALAQLPCLEELELQFAWQFGDAGIAALSRLSALSRLDLIYRCLPAYSCVCLRRACAQRMCTHTCVRV